MEGDTVSFCPFNQAFIVINARSWLCDSLKLLFHDCREVCAHECVFRRRRKREREREREREKRGGSVSMCMTRGCIRGAGIASLERRGRAGVTNQLWESRLEKTHPLFSPQRERAEEQIRQTSSGQNHCKWMAITKKYQAGREGKQRPTRLLPHAASHSAPSSPFSTPAVTNATAGSV